MKDKFIRCVSPIEVIISFAVEASGIGFLVYAIKELKGRTDFYAVIFYIVTVFAIVLGFFMIKQAFSQGVIFYSDNLEFTDIDNANIFEYKKIKSVDSYKDTKVSFKKKVVERFSLIIIELDDGTSVTITLGYTTKRTLNKIVNEIKSRIR
ncbi:hypothetical protein [Eubacterium sp.]|uniref:hypothetical protein n=1 Tax=Eubacterium sp. TaxID=142586 RepID=UPI002A81E390|nr:hypothetical protein [Eubacterium sp.]MDY3812051.1 hypothetical protein [Eubacterium sp.]